MKILKENGDVIECNIEEYKILKALEEQNIKPPKKPKFDPNYIEEAQLEDFTHLDEKTTERKPVRRICKSWTTPEVQILIKKSNELKVDELHKLLPQRTPGAISTKIKELVDAKIIERHRKIFKSWTDEEEQQISDNFIYMTDDELFTLLKGKRTVAAIKAKASELRKKGLLNESGNKSVSVANVKVVSNTPKKRKGGWPDSELIIIKNNANLPAYKILEMLPHRSIASITKKRSDMVKNGIISKPKIKIGPRTPATKEHDSKLKWVGKRMSELRKTGYSRRQAAKAAWDEAKRILDW